MQKEESGSVDTYSAARDWASEWPDVKNHKQWLNPVWHRILYSCTHMATVSVKRIKMCWYADAKCTNAVSDSCACVFRSWRQTSSQAVFRSNSLQCWLVVAVSAVSCRQQSLTVPTNHRSAVVTSPDSRECTLSIRINYFYGKRCTPEITKYYLLYHVWFSTVLLLLGVNTV